MLYFTSLNSKINDKFNTKIRLTDTFESSDKLVKVFYGSKDSSTPFQPFLPWGFANFEPFTCLPKSNNVYNNIILQIEYFQDSKDKKLRRAKWNDTRSGKPRVPFPWSLAVHHRSVALRNTKLLRKRLDQGCFSWFRGPELLISGYDFVHFTGQ